MTSHTDTNAKPHLTIHLDPATKTQKMEDAEADSAACAEKINTINDMTVARCAN